MIRLEARREFPVPVTEAFAYITDMEHWREYWPDFVRIQDRAQARWNRAGDAVTIVLKLLGRERELHMTLEQFQPDTMVAYSSRQAGLPDARHERHFRPLGEGFEYHLVVGFEPRPGLTGLLDRVLVRRAIAKALRKTLDNLGGIFCTTDALDS